MTVNERQYDIDTFIGALLFRQYDTFIGALLFSMIFSNCCFIDTWEKEWRDCLASSSYPRARRYLWGGGGSWDGIDNDHGVMMSLAVAVTVVIHHGCGEVPLYQDLIARKSTIPAFVIPSIPQHPTIPGGFGEE